MAHTSTATSRAVRAAFENPQSECHSPLRSHLVRSVFVPDHTSEHGCYIFRVREGDKLIAMKRERNEFQPMHHTVEEPIKVVPLVRQRPINVLRSGRGPSRLSTRDRGSINSANGRRFVAAYNKGSSTRTVSTKSP